MRVEHLIFPVHCPACEVTSTSFCGLCRPEVDPWHAASCLRCGADNARNCVCDRLPDEVRWIQAFWRFEGPVRDVVEFAKYGGELWRLKSLKAEISGWLGTQVSDLSGRIAVVPVPPSPRRIRRRGFDLPLILAKWTCRWPGTSIHRRTLKRIREVDAQAGQDRQQRFASVEGAFLARRCPERVILVDDVITTGATVTACSQALAAAGAKRIGVVALARTPRIAVSQ
jgi:ComF family protein